MDGLRYASREVDSPAPLPRPPCCRVSHRLEFAGGQRWTQPTGGAAAPKLCPGNAHVEEPASPPAVVHQLHTGAGVSCLSVPSPASPLCQAPCSDSTAAIPCHTCHAVWEVEEEGGRSFPFSANAGGRQEPGAVACMGLNEAPVCTPSTLGTLERCPGCEAVMGSLSPLGPRAPRAEVGKAMGLEHIPSPVPPPAPAEPEVGPEPCAATNPPGAPLCHEPSAARTPQGSEHRARVHVFSMAAR